MFSKKTLILKLIFLISVLAIKQIESDLNSIEICLKKKLFESSEKCLSSYSYECGSSYCTTNKEACQKLNDVERVVKINEM